MIVKCSKCAQRYERFNTGDHGFPNLCSSCIKESGNKLMKCNICGKKVYFKERGYPEMRRWQCSHCQSYFIPFRMRHFGNRYVGYPKWVKLKDWNTRKFAPEIEIIGTNIKS